MKWEAADDQLIAEIASLAHAFARSIVDRHSAEDLAQDVTLQCLVKIRAGTWRVDAEAPREFVRRVVRRKAVDVLRRSQAREERHVEYMADAPKSHAWMCPDLDYEERELAEFHEDALGRLPEACRRAYLLVRDEHETYRSSASRLGVRPTTVKSHIVKAQQRFRNELAARGISPSVNSSPRARRRKGRTRSTVRKTVEG